MEQAPKEYYAFISYKREDEKWAKWLQHKLEHYRLPSGIRSANRHLPRELRPVFKDTSELASGVLADEISQALENSRYLIVICSPRAARSEWVCKEVQTFIDMGRTEQIIPFIIGGTARAANPADECFPTALLGLPKEQELLGINIGEMGRDAAAVKVVARILGLKFDTLWQRYEKERTRRTAIISASAVALLLILGIAAWTWRKNVQLEQSNLAMLETQARFIAEKAGALMDDGDAYTACLLAQEVLPRHIDHPQRPYVPEAEFALRQAYNRHTALLKSEQGTIQAVSFSTDGRTIMAVLNDSAGVLLWDAETGALTDTLVASPTLSFDTSLTRYGHLALSIYDQRYVRLSEQGGAGPWIASWGGLGGAIDCAVFSPDGHHIALGSADNYLRIIDADNGQVTASVRTHHDKIRTVEYSPDGDWLLTASNDHTLQLQPATLHGRPTIMSGHQGTVYSARFSPDGRHIVSASDDHTARLWDTQTGRCLHILSGHTDAVRYAVFSPDGNRVATASYDHDIRIWDTATGQCLQVLQGHYMAVCAVSFSSDGHRLVSSSWDNTIKIWDLATATVLTEWEGYTRGIRTVCFSPDDRCILSSSWTSDIRIWHAATGRLIHRLDGHRQNVSSVAFSADGTRIVSASADSTVRVWDFPALQTLIDQTHERFRSRQLTPAERHQYYLE